MKLCGNYYLEADHYNFILLYDKGNGKGPKPLGYYTSMSGVLRAVLRHTQKTDIRANAEDTCNVEYVALLSSKLDDLERTIDTAVNSVKEITPVALQAYTNSKKDKKASKVNTAQTQQTTDTSNTI